MNTTNTFHMNFLCVRIFACTPFQVLPMCRVCAPIFGFTEETTDKLMHNSHKPKMCRAQFVAKKRQKMRSGTI